MYIIPFDLVLPDGTVLNVEQAGDDVFSIVRQNGMVAYIKYTNPAFTPDDTTETTGRN